MCGPRSVSPLDRHAIINPTFLIEVTSNSTEDYDRGEKLTHYKTCASVRAVLLISHRRAEVTLSRRDGATWSERIFSSGEHLRLEEPALTLSVDELYAGIDLDAPS